MRMFDGLYYVDVRASLACGEEAAVWYVEYSGVRVVGFVRVYMCVWYKIGEEVGGRKKGETAE